MSILELQQARYVSLVTFRRSGKAVPTPVWAAFHEGAFYIFSAGDAGKVKRLRNSNRARLAKCDARGGSLGEYFEARAELIADKADVTRALQALRGKYGWQMWLADIGARLTGRFAKRAYIRVVLDEPQIAEEPAHDQM
ncbi:MAG: PPOX class F420-dependent oxidoreductase [Gammaproteobacteria bacterium]|nr:PPOX class F420-dependent oxidoreductase [Gammaproteobacteria bacterium]